MCRIVFPNLVFIVLMSVRLINSQAFDARIEGTVTDSTGAAVAGARISAVNTENGSVLVGATDDSGLYRFPIATLGHYTLTVERAGFKKLVRSGVQLRSPQTVTIDVVLEPGDTTENVTVNADAAVTDESKFHVGNNVNARDVKSLPLVSRNPFNFVLLQPATSGRTVGGPSVIQLNSAGLLRRVGDHFDGAYINDSDRSGFRLIFVSEVFINDMQLLSGGYSAEFGNTAGAVVNITSRSGSNRIAGEATLLLRPAGLSSRSFGSNDLPAQDDIGAYGFTGSLGGPIIKDRWHYYFGYEHTVRKYLPVIAVDAASRAALVAAGVSDSIFVNSEPIIDHFPYLIVRTDAQLSKGSRLSFRYDRFDVDTKNFGVGDTDTTELSRHIGGGDYAMGSQLVTAFSGTFFNEVRFAFARQDTFLKSDERSGTGPSILIRSNGDIAAFGPSTSIGAVDTGQSTTQFIDSLTKVFARHEIKVGAGINFIRDGTVDALFSQYEFSSVAAYASAVNGSAPKGYEFYTEAFGEPKRPMNAIFVNAFVQEDWRVTRRLKLNLGVRYELFRPPDSIADSPYKPSRHFRIDKNNFAFRVGAAYLLNDGDHKTVIRIGSGLHYDPLQLRFYRRALLNNGDPRFFTFRFGPGDVGAPVFPARIGTFPAGAALLRPSIDAVSPDFTTMYAVHSNLQIEHSLSDNMSITAGYLSTIARHIPVISNVNCLPTGGTLADGRPLYGTTETLGDGTVRLLLACSLPRLPQFGQVLMAESSGNLLYNGVFVQLYRRFSSGFQAMATYTYSKATDDAPESVPGGQFQTDPSDRGRDRGASVADVRHLFRASFVAEPRIHLGNRFASGVLSGFQFSAIVLADSGEAFNITTNFDLNRDGVPGDRPVGIPRNFGRLPAFLGVDMRVSRGFKLGERFGLEFYCEAANVFNIKAVSSYYPSSILARNGASPVNPLTGELRGPLPAFTSATAVWRPAREIQLGMKVRF